MMSKSLFYQVSIVFSVLLLAAADWACTSVKTSGSEELARSRTTYAGLADTAAYVGIQTCASCHPNVHSTYLHTGMGSSFDTASVGKSSADFAGHPVVNDPIRNLSYHPFWKGDQLYFREFRIEGGDTTHLREERISYIVGSGQHTNSHIWESNGYLFQAPLTYYTQKGKWDLPPGFEDGNNTRFNRIIGNECMSCHNGLPEFVKGSANKFSLVKNGIDCERCHGPGSIHVREKSMGILIDTSLQIDFSIVNPAKLPIDLQFDICQRCHIQGNAVLRPGKSFADFRPGMKLSDVMYVFMPVYEDDGEQHIMASHAERLRMSSCFISSNQNSRNSTGLKPYKDGMTCVTCHNPHVSVRADGPGRFNTICTNCHAKKQVSDCSESIKLRKVKNDNCTACHMPLHGAADIPHVSIHDHRIGIHRDQRTSKRTDDLLKGIRCIHEQTVPSIVEAEAFVNYVEKFNMPESLLDSALIRLNKSAQDKEALCLRIRISYLRREYSYVRKLVSDNPDLINELAVVEPENKDAWTAYRISESFQVTSGIPSNVQESIRWLEKACKLAPLIPEFCSKLGTAYASAGRFKESEKKYENLIREHPEYAPGYCNLGYLRLTQGNRSEAMRLLKKSIQLDPDYLQAHLNLASYYLSIGDRKNAISSLKKVLNLDPGNVQAKAALRQI